MLTEYEEIVTYLINNSFLSADQIIGSGLSIENVSRRNCNLKVLSGEGPDYFLKQETRERSESDKNFASIAYEAQVYKLFEAFYKDKEITHFLPRYYAFDATEKLLILEAIADSINLAEYHFSKGRFPSFISGNLGKALATIHKKSGGEKSLVEKFIGNTGTPPWIFFITKPEQLLYINSSKSNVELIGIIQRSEELCISFANLKNEWRTSCLVHGDIKFVNCLVNVNSASKQKAKVFIIDWELARFGDPCWDIGSVFSEYLNMWLGSIPISMEHSPDKFLDFAQFPLEKMKPAIRSFWNAYIDTMKINDNELTDWLSRAASFAGIRLIQAAYEQSQNETTISTKVIFLLQLSSNILRRPVEAAVQLLGLPIANVVHDEIRVH